MSDNHLRYKEQWSYPIQTWRVPYTADFAIFRGNRCLPVAIIECQGEQHDHPIEFFGGQVSFEKQLIRDFRKRTWCEANSVSLLEIPYEHRDERCHEDLVQFIAENFSIPEDALWACLHSNIGDIALPFARDSWRAKRH